MVRWIWTCAALFLGVLLISWALMVPAHLKALDAAMLPAAGRGTTSVIDFGTDLVRAGEAGAAEIAAAVGAELNLSGRTPLLDSLDQIKDPNLITWGVDAPQLTEIWGQDARYGQRPTLPISRWLASSTTRVAARKHLEALPSFAVRQVLLARNLTNLTKFPPLQSPAGPAWDGATLLTGLLVSGNYLSEHLETEIEGLALGAVRRGEVPAFELCCLDLLSLANRLNWGQLTELLQAVENRATLGTLADLARTRATDFPMLYTASLLLGSPKTLVDYVVSHGEAGLGDVRFALKSGQGALQRLVTGELRVKYPNVRNRLLEYEPFYSAFLPLRQIAAGGWWAGLGLKLGLLLVGGWLVAYGLGLLSFLLEGRTSTLKISWAQVCLAAGMALLVLILSEPFLVQGPERMKFPLHWNFPMVGKDVRTTIDKAIRPVMDLLSWVSLAGFLVIQAVVYAFGLLKLAEIRRQPVSAQLKLKLLENEESMFDSGLYVGLGGTVASLIFLAIGVVKPSLMAAYASTFFGIIFVAVLRIFHLRPFRKTLILGSETR